LLLIARFQHVNSSKNKFFHAIKHVSFNFERQLQAAFLIDEQHMFTTGYIGLAISSFLSATILPFASEGVLILMLHSGFDPVGCLITASFSNTIGSFVTYFVGKLGDPTWTQRFKLDPKRLEKFQSFIQRYGFWAGLIAWVPIIGDTITLALGFFRVPFLPTALAIAIGKTLRYAIIIALMQ